MRMRSLYSHLRRRILLVSGSSSPPSTVLYSSVGLDELVISPMTIPRIVHALYPAQPNHNATNALYFPSVSGWTQECVFHSAAAFLRGDGSSQGSRTYCRRISYPNAASGLNVLKCDRHTPKYMYLCLRLQKNRSFSFLFPPIYQAVLISSGR